MKALLDWLRFRAILLALAGLRLVPEPLAYSTCRLLAGCFWALDRRHRAVGMTNLAIAFPDRSESWRRLMLYESFLQLGDLAVEIARLSVTTPRELLARVAYEPGLGLEHYLEAKRGGQGVLFVTGHVSAWELLPAAHAARGFPLSFLVRALKNPRLDEWSHRLRSRFGNRALDKRHSLRKVMSLIEKGQDVGFLLDQNVQEREGLYVPFFGRPACTSASVAAIAVRTGAPIVLGFLCPTARRGHYRIRFYPSLRARSGTSRKEEIRSLTALINAHFESVIREFPSHWLWGHRRFQTQPHGQSPYR